MKTFRFHKADPVRDPIPDVVLYFDRPLPESLDLRELALLHLGNGRDLATVLRQVLPGGTLDALLQELLLQRASLLRVPMPDADPTTGS